jgi:hypothetical protein
MSGKEMRFNAQVFPDRRIYYHAKAIRLNPGGRS